MTTTIEKDGAVWTIIHDRYEQARNAMSPHEPGGGRGLA